MLADADLEEFVVEHYDRLIRLARLICRDASDAADAVQLALEQAWRRRSSLRGGASLRPWLDWIVAREAIRRAPRVRGGPSPLTARPNAPRLVDNRLDAAHRQAYTQRRPNSPWRLSSAFAHDNPPEVVHVQNRGPISGRSGED